ncbi:hypothetical protein EFW17_09525 [Halostreptopolyspora alba]|uniref:Uncharacterized protein n=1 Tax=Halostreptopolyspora alba TaxID=2487137 RepID=A0A3N0EBV9_9ACTN|nr:hypothetical protein EFW17_09525 [Nocardiopsaceae bacterium YIM 96095]
MAQQDARRLVERFLVGGVVASPGHAAYTTTPAGRLRQRFAEQDGRQANDPVRAARVILRAVEDPESPLRLPLGPEAIDRIREKITGQAEDLDSYETLARDTRF